MIWLFNVQMSSTDHDRNAQNKTGSSMTSTFSKNATIKPAPDSQIASNIARSLTKNASQFSEAVMSQKFQSHTKQNLFVMMAALCSFCIFYIVVTVFSPEPVGLMRKNCPGCRISECICARTDIQTFDIVDICLLAVSRILAYATYPLLVAIFFTKCNNLRVVFEKSYLVEYLPFADLHSFHAFSGWTVALASTVHGISHMVRWGRQGILTSMLSYNISGGTGIICLALAPLIVFPMRFEWFKKNVSFEVRKGLHYLGFVWGAIIMWHAPVQKHMAPVIGIAVFGYLLDYVYGFFFKIYHVKTSHFCRIEPAMQLSFAKPDGFDFEEIGYIYLCVPWISKFEWHAFSVYGNSDDPNQVYVCMAVVGDKNSWTTKLHAALEQPTVRPVWVYGPFPSPFDMAMNRDEVICVATGIGISPSLNVVHKYRESRRIHLIWMCRDTKLVEFFLNTFRFDDDAWTLVYYTGEEGKEKLSFKKQLPRYLMIFKGRPDLEAVVSRILTDQYHDYVYSGGTDEFKEDAPNQSNEIPSEERFKNVDVMYCGGSAPVVSDLQRITKKHKMGLQIEKFDW